jgi:hypothetical protein
MVDTARGGRFHRRADHGEQGGDGHSDEQR